MGSLQECSQARGLLNIGRVPFALPRHLAGGLLSGCVVRPGLLCVCAFWDGDTGTFVRNYRRRPGRSRTPEGVPTAVVRKASSFMGQNCNKMGKGVNAAEPVGFLPAQFPQNSSGWLIPAVF